MGPCTWTLAPPCTTPGTPPSPSCHPCWYTPRVLTSVIEARRAILRSRTLCGRLSGGHIDYQDPVYGWIWLYTATRTLYMAVYGYQDPVYGPYGP